MKVYFTKNLVKVFDSIPLKLLEKTLNTFFLEVYEKKGRIMNTFYRVDEQKVLAIITYTEEIHPHKV